MKPDIVYIYGEGLSTWRGQELKYSLRSLEKYGRNYGKVFIVGDKPKYLNDKVIHIPQRDDLSYSKERRICEKIITACQSDAISDPFVMFNDDFFLVKEIDFSDLPYYYSDNLANKIERRPKRDIYKIALENTYYALREKKLDILYYDIHYPILYHKDWFKKAIALYGWKIRGGYVIKSLYANTMMIEGQERKDVKIYNSHSRKFIREVISGTDLFSTDTITRAMAETFNELYPNKCKYESF